MYIDVYLTIIVLEQNTMYIYQFCFLFSLNPRLLGEVVFLISLCSLLDKDNKGATFPNEMLTFNNHLIC